MGLLGALFGGGTKLELKLDAEAVPAGGQLSGQIIVHGGKKPLKIDSLFVRLLLVSVVSKEGQSIPEIDLKLLVDSVIATKEDLPPGAAKRYSFRFPVPTGLAPSANGVSYTVLAQADIPGVVDPKQEAKLKIIESRGSGMLTLQQIYDRYPGLNSTDKRELANALSDLDCACYSERELLLAAEPRLVELVRSAGDGAVRRAAFSAWANLVDNQVKKHHLSFLAEVSAQSNSSEFFLEVIKAAAKFAEEGALPMVQDLAKSADPEIRLRITEQLRFSAADRFPGKRELLLSLAMDPEARVRAAAIEALSEWRDDVELMRWIASVADHDTSELVQAACISALSLSHHYGGSALTLDVYERQVRNPSELVRKTIAESIHWLSESDIARIYPLVAALLADSSGEVRSAMGFQFHNLSDMRQLAPLGLQVLERDPSEEVRSQTLGGVTSLLEPAQAIPLLEKYLRSAPSERMLWGVLSGLRNHREVPQARALLAELGRGSTGVAHAARDALE